MAKNRIQNLLKHIVCILLCLCVVLPFYMVLINSFKTKAEAARMSLALPTEWVFSNYSEVIEKGSHAELLKLKGEYYELYKNQFINEGIEKSKK